MTAAVDFPRRLDSRLPDLDGLFDVGRVAARFASAWGTDVVDCRLLDARYEPGARCAATYAVSSSTAPDTIGAIEVTPDAWIVRHYVDDPALAGLREATDPAAMGALLAGPLGARGCTVTPVRYRAGERAVLRYDVDAPTGPLVAFGKVVRSGVAGLAAALGHLHDRAEAGAGPLVPAPTAVSERLGLVVLPAVEGRPLHGVVFDQAIAVEDRAGACRVAGEAIARLHAGRPFAASVSTADDRRELEGLAGPLHAIDVSLGRRWTAALEALAAGDAREAETVPSHGALRTDQILVTPDGPALLDLDGFCTAHPARDLGNLRAYLRWRAVRRPDDAAAAAVARDAFLAGYEAVRALPTADDLAHHEGLSLLKIAARRYRNLDAAEWPLVPELLGAAEVLSRMAP
jgi:Ser/Thr protein kinase RdoA (MazF antagonist)